MMDEPGHSPDDSQVVGYGVCRNPHCTAGWIIREILERTDGLCIDCWRDQYANVLAEIEVRSRGRSLRMPARPRSRRGTKGDRSTAVLADKAKRRARKRLAMIFPDLYDVLLAEERARVGLEPFPVEVVLHDDVDMDAHETLEFAAVYHALIEHGVDLDALEST